MKFKTLFALSSLLIASTLCHYADDTYGTFEVVNINDTGAPIYLDNKTIRIKSGDKHVQPYQYMQFHHLARSFFDKWGNTQIDPEDISVYPASFTLVTDRYLLDIKIEITCDATAPDCGFDHLRDAHVTDPNNCQTKCNGRITRTFKKLL